MFFDSKLQLVPGLSGSIQVQGGGTTGWHNSGSVTIGPGTVGNNVIQPAYVIIYVDNQTIGKNVWFDNVHVEHYTSKLLEEDHYYPFGLTMKIDQAAQSNLPNQPYKYQGIQLERHFGLEMYETFYRGLDPQLGRFMQIDPKADSAYEFSPYISMNNNPVRYVDPEGDFPFLIPFIPAIVNAAIVATAAVATYFTVDIVVDKMKAKQQARETNSASSTKTEDKVKKEEETSTTATPAVQKGGGKNAAHANQKARESAAARYEEAKKQRDELKSKTNKTKEDKKQLEKLEKQVKHEKQKMDNTGENHSQKAKGSN